MAKVSPDDVERAIQELQAHYNSGKERTLYVPHDAKLSSSDREKLRKARVFAECYTEADLTRLFDLCRAHECALGWTTIARLATIDNKQDRRRLEKEAITGHWSKVHVDRVIRGRFGNHKGHQVGRLPHKLESVDDALSELSRLLALLSRWNEQMDQRDNEISLAKLPESVRKKVKALRPQCLDLEKSVTSALKRRRAAP